MTAPTPTDLAVAQIAATLVAGDAASVPPGGGWGADEGAMAGKTSYITAARALVAEAQRQRTEKEGENDGA